MYIELNDNLLYHSIYNRTMVDWKVLLKWGAYNKSKLVENFPYLCKM